MTQKSTALNDRGEAIKIPGWFSWRHKGSEAHEEARARYLSEHGPAARRRKAVEADRGLVSWHSCGHKHGETSPGRCASAVSA